MAPSALFRTPSDRDVVIPTEQEQSSGGFSGSRKGSMFERRRRRKNKVQDDSRSDLSSDMTPSQQQSNSAMSREKRRQQRKQKKAEDDIDPYDSDPGQSYREHCKQNRGFSTKSCLAVPKFLNKSGGGGREEQSVLTAPPSPLQSEMGDLGQAPASLPPSLTRVRCSLRSSITDGAEPQPLGPTVMERRDLRPNNVQMHVSHWSEEGGRPYMEDRYVFSSVVGIDWGLFVLLERIILG